MGCSSSRHTDSVEKQGVDNSEHSLSSVSHSKSKVKSSVTQRTKENEEVPTVNSESDEKDGELKTRTTVETHGIQCNALESKETEYNSQNTEDVQKSPITKNITEKQNHVDNNAASGENTKGLDM